MRTSRSRSRRLQSIPNGDVDGTDSKRQFPVSLTLFFPLLPARFLLLSFPSPRRHTFLAFLRFQLGSHPCLSRSSSEFDLLSQIDLALSFPFLSSYRPSSTPKPTPEEQSPPLSPPSDSTPLPLPTPLMALLPVQHPKISSPSRISPLRSQTSAT